MTKREFWVGPAQAGWYRFKLAQTFLKLRFRCPRIRYIPYLDCVTAWALDVTLGSREVTEVSSDDE